MWKIVNILEGDFGCEERMPGEPLMVFVNLESDDGRMCQLQVADQWLISQGLEEGDEWPDDMDDDQTEKEAAAKQMEFLENFLGALSEMNE